MTNQVSLDPRDAIAELGRINLAEHDLQQVLARVAELARRAVPGADEVSVTVVHGDTARTPACTGELARRLDETQYDRGYGPCLDAAATGTTMLIKDMSVDDRWPSFAAAATALGARSSMSVGLPVQHALTGGLNVYARRLDSFDDDAVALAQTFAGYAGVALANAHLVESTTALAQQMQAAMATRAVIEQAKGILMGNLACGPDEAFGTLTRMSQQANRKLRDIAAEVVQAARKGNFS